MKFLFFLFLFANCQKEYNKATCENLSLKKYRGFPQASYEFDKECSKFNIHYTTKLCQQSFIDLLTHGNETMLKKRFGNKVLKCFTKEQLKKHLIY